MLSASMARKASASLHRQPAKPETLAPGVPSEPRGAVASGLTSGVCEEGRRYLEAPPRASGQYCWGMTRAQLDKQPADVSAMFDKVADRYDLLNDALSLGMDRWWRKAVAATVGAGAGQLVLDLAAGTGTSSRVFASAGAKCVACDFSLGM